MYLINVVESVPLSHTKTTTVIWKKFVGKIFLDGWAHPKIIYSEKIAQRIFRTLIITVYVMRSLPQTGPPNMGRLQTAYPDSATDSVNH